MTGMIDNHSGDVVEENKAGDGPPRYMDITEFREAGYLQEANRVFFHPLGLALEVVIDVDSGRETLEGIWDCRDDPEGILFNDLSGETAKDKADSVRSLFETIRVERIRKFDWAVQPIGHKLEGDEAEPTDEEYNDGAGFGPYRPSNPLR